MAAKHPVQTPNGISVDDWLQIKKWNEVSPERCHFCIHHVFEQQVDMHPTAPAICAWDGDLTYDELDELSSMLAGHLVALGVKRGTYVPFCFEKSLWAVVATAAILKAGGAYVPLDLSLPSDRLSRIIKDVGTRVVIVSQLCVERVSGMAQEIVTVTRDFVQSLTRISLPVPAEAAPEDPALILFTSGSTGQPKGIVLQHGAVVTNARSHGEALQIHSNSRVLQFAAYGWDIATMDMWTTLMRGGCICIPSEQERRGDIARVMNRMRVNWALLTPTFASILRAEEVPDLRVLVCAGEPMKQDLIIAWVDRVRLFNAYGPAETGICTAVEYHDSASRAENIGKQLIANVCWVVDQESHDKLVPIGTIGELIVEGPNIALGYLNDRAKTEAAFVDNPKWLKRDRLRRKRRFYKTGDLVRYQKDGSMSFIGRKDTQVKIRGQRVELGEIESNIEMQCGVSQSIVCLPKHGPFHDQLVAVVQFTELASQRGLDGQIRMVDREKQPTSVALCSQLSVFLHQRLPTYAIPDKIIPVQSLPLSSSAKIDRNTVGMWLESMSAKEVELIIGRNATKAIATDVNPHQPTARRLSEKIIELLKTSSTNWNGHHLNSDAPLVAIGINSINFIQLSTFITRTWGIDIPFSKLIGHQTTIGELARYIESEHEHEGENGHCISASELLEEVRSLRLELERHARHMSSYNCEPDQTPATVFITGGSGFLGTQILRLLLTQSSVERVIAHVRAKDEVHGYERVLSTAKKFKWWQDSYLQRLEVWIGDLAEPRVGLSVEKWQRLQGMGEMPVNAIIHNGAYVNWMHDYSTLRAINVTSTVELLRGSLESTSIARFIYVSGGQHLSIKETTDEQSANEVIRTNGYAQTKLVSELLVRDIGRVVRKMDSTTQFSIVKPGYIIGTTSEGIANPDDFLWRLAAGVIEVNGYNSSDEESELFVTGSDQVAESIVQSCLCPGQVPETTKMLDSVPMSDFWKSLRRFNANIKPLEEKEWLCLIAAATMAKGASHPLYPCIQIVKSTKGKVGCLSSFVGGHAPKTRMPVQIAIIKSMEYLSSIGFFTPKISNILY